MTFGFFAELLRKKQDWKTLTVLFRNWILDFDYNILSDSEGYPVIKNSLIQGSLNINSRYNSRLKIFHGVYSLCLENLSRMGYKNELFALLDVLKPPTEEELDRVFDGRLTGKIEPENIRKHPIFRTFGVDFFTRDKSLDTCSILPALTQTNNLVFVEKIVQKFFEIGLKPRDFVLIKVMNTFADHIKETNRLPSSMGTNKQTSRLFKIEKMILKIIFNLKKFEIENQDLCNYLQSAKADGRIATDFSPVRYLVEILVKSGKSLAAFNFLKRCSVLRATNQTGLRKTNQFQIQRNLLFSSSVKPSELQLKFLAYNSDQLERLDKISPLKPSEDILDLEELICRKGSEILFGEAEDLTTIFNTTMRGLAIDCGVDVVLDRVNEVEVMSLSFFEKDVRNPANPPLIKKASKKKGLVGTTSDGNEDEISSLVWKPDIFFLSWLLSKCTNFLQIERVVKLADELKSNIVFFKAFTHPVVHNRHNSIDVAFITSVIMAFSKLGKPDLAEIHAKKLLIGGGQLQAGTKSKKTPLLPDNYVYNSMILAWGKAGYYDRAVMWFDWFVEDVKKRTNGAKKKSKVLIFGPDIVTFNSLLVSVLCSGLPYQYFGKVDLRKKEFDRWIEQMSLFGIKPDMESFNLIIQSIILVNPKMGVSNSSRLTMKRGIDNCLSLIKKENLTYTPKTWHLLIEGYSSHNFEMEMLATFEEMEEHFEKIKMETKGQLKRKKSVKNKTTTINHQIKINSKTSKSKNDGFLLKEFLPNDIILQIYISIISFYANTGNILRVDEWIFKLKKKEKLQPSARILSHLLKAQFNSAISKEKERVRLLIEQSLTPPNRTAPETLLKPMFDMVFENSKHAIQTDNPFNDQIIKVKPFATPLNERVTFTNSFLLNNLMNFCVEGGFLDECFRLYHWLHETARDDVSISILLKCCLKGDFFEEAEAIWYWITKNRIEIDVSGLIESNIVSTVGRKTDLITPRDLPLSFTGPCDSSCITYLQLLKKSKNKDLFTKRWKEIKKLSPKNQIQTGSLVVYVQELGMQSEERRQLSWPNEHMYSVYLDGLVDMGDEREALAVLKEEMGYGEGVGKTLKIRVTDQIVRSLAKKMDRKGDFWNEFADFVHSNLPEFSNIIKNI